MISSRITISAPGLGTVNGLISEAINQSGVTFYSNLITYDATVDIFEAKEAETGFKITSQRVPFAPESLIKRGHGHYTVILDNVAQLTPYNLEVVIEKVKSLSAELEAYNEAHPNNRVSVVFSWVLQRISEIDDPLIVSIYKKLSKELY